MVLHASSRCALDEDGIGVVRPVDWLPQEHLAYFVLELVRAELGILPMTHVQQVRWRMHPKLTTAAGQATA